MAKWRLWRPLVTLRNILRGASEAGAPAWWRASAPARPLPNVLTALASCDRTSLGRAGRGSWTWPSSAACQGPPLPLRYVKILIAAPAGECRSSVATPPEISGALGPRRLHEADARVSGNAGRRRTLRSLNRKARSAPIPDWESVLARAVQHVERGKALVAQQRERTDRLRAIGAATEDAERTLELLLLTLATLESHKEYLFASARHFNRA